MSTLKKIVKTGIDALGGVAGTGVGFLVAGPVGAYAGAVISPFISTTLKEFANQISNHLSKREEIRIGYTLGTLANRFQEKSENGILLRNDGFFDDTEIDRSSGKIILEKLVQVTQKEVEEKKLPFLMNLYEYISFNEDIDKDEAFYLMKTMENLSYRQLCLIKIVNEIGLIPLDFQNTNGERQEQATNFRRMDLVSDLMMLSQKGIGLLEMSTNFNNLPIHYQESEYSKQVEKMLKLDKLNKTDVEQIKNKIVY